MRAKLNNLFMPPHPALRPYIAHYTVTYPSPELEGGTLSLVPDASGCLIFKFDSDRLRSFFWGATTRTVEVQRDANADCTALFVEFRPGGAHALLGLEAGEYTDLRLALDDAAPALNLQVRQIFDSSRQTGRLIQELDRLFLKLLSDSRTMELQRKVSELLELCGKAPTVQSLSDTTCYSARHLGRLLKPVIGMSVKQYLRMLRINRTIQVMKSSQKPLTALAHEMGYYDQAHFIHDFKQVCGVSPQMYLSRMSDFYNEDFKF